MESMMTKKQEPWVVVTAVWTPFIEGKQFSRPIRKQAHFVMAISDNDACNRVQKTLKGNRKIWLTRCTKRQYDDAAQKLANKCFAENGVQIKGA
jgi:hypothetical protein